jgi:ribosomal protein S27AE
MAEIIRHCPDCGWDRPFAQLHAVPGCCPDTADGHCPEWFCPNCGAAVILGGGVPVWIELPQPAGVRDRVA